MTGAQFWHYILILWIILYERVKQNWLRIRRDRLIIKYELKNPFLDAIMYQAASLWVID